MSVQANERPVIIKRKKKVIGGGHHGGAWKVAYADFVTAMMAFFMLMWLLNATTEQQRSGIADYFSPTIPISPISGGGDGALGGDSILSEDTLTKDETGQSGQASARQDRSRSDVTEEPQDDAALEKALQDLDERLQGMGGESTVMRNAAKHIETRITDEGLVIELFELDGVPLFEDAGDTPTQLLRDLTTLIAQTAKTVTNDIAVGGHVQADPVVMLNSPVWDLSAARADRMRRLLTTSGLNPGRAHRVTGHADRNPVMTDPMAQRNNRLEVILLRDVPRN